jgi:murein DD-endopeptidase MepM/ murein hydrolase activator NlpD
MSKAAQYRDARIFTAGAACGFLAGAFVVAVILWQFGGAAGLHTRPSGEPAETVADTTHAQPGSPETPPPSSRASERPASTMGRERPATAPAEGAPPAAPLAETTDVLRARHLEIPVEGVNREQLTRQFTDKRGESREHEALDILAPRDTPVKAVEAGRVAKLFLSKAGGITVYQFDPSERYCYYYAHLERYADGLKEGDTLTRGQVLGYVGTSGNAPKNTPHLHFAVFRLNDDKHWWEGTPLDPYDILR